MDNYNSSDFFTRESFQRPSEPISTYTAKTFGWMFLGLMTTFLVSVATIGSMVASSGIRSILFAPYVPFILLLAEIGVVIFLSSRIATLSVGAAKALFFVYAVLNGIVFSTIFLSYGMFSVLGAFLATSIYFGIMAGVGYFTKVDLSGMRPILFSGLIFLIGFWVLSMFLNLGAFERIVSLIGVAVFLGFTAYDTQKIRAYHAAFAGDPEMSKKASIYSALQLYLDFINLFLYILRIMARKN